MTCAEYEDALLTATREELLAEPARQLRTHLEGCGACREFRHRVESLDTQLAWVVGEPKLPAAFSSRLLEIVDSHPLTNPVPREAEKSRAEQEFQTRIQQLRGQWRRRRNWRLGALAAVCATLLVMGPSLWKLLPPAYRVASWLPSIANFDPLVPLCWAFAALVFGWFVLAARAGGESFGAGRDLKSV
jgi:hypothetical protein